MDSEPAESEVSPVSLSMFADAYFAFQSNEPGTLATANAHRSYAGQGPTGLSENGFSLSFLGLDASYEGKNFGATGSLRFGSSMPIFHGNDPSVGIDNITQGYVSWMPGEGLSLDMGMFGTIFGAEVGESWKNLNYTRGALYYYGQPFWHTGLRASYEISDSVGVTGMVVNGTNNISETVQGDGGTDQTPSIAAQISFSPTDNASIIAGGMLALDSEANDDAGFDTFFDVVATLSLGATSVVLNADYVITAGQGGADDRSFLGLSAGVGYAVSESFGVAGRFEYHMDDRGAPDADARTLLTGTATHDFKPAPNQINRHDGRFEQASEDDIGLAVDPAAGSPDATDTWFAGVLGVVVTTDP
jgi:hypothetical protein